MTSHTPGDNRVAVSLITDGLLLAVDTSAQNDGLSRSTLMRKAIMDYLHVDANGQPKPVKPAPDEVTRPMRRVLESAVRWYQANRTRPMHPDKNPELWAYYLEEDTAALVMACADLTFGRPE